MTRDDLYMERALFLAARGRGRTSPNPLVGAVVVSPDGVVVGQGAHEYAGGPHAEVYALAAAGDRARGATLYCTLEPCCHTGRTGPCTQRIIAAGISRVVAALEDPNPRVCGKGFAALRESGIDVMVGVGEESARRLNQPFFTWLGAGRPFVIVKAAISADGRIAEAKGVRTPLTCDSANRHAQLARSEVDAIGVGSETLLVDDPLLTPRGVYRARPLTRVVFDRRLRTPPAARVLSTRDAGPVIIMTTARSAACARLRAPLEAAGAELEIADGPTLAAAMRRLGARGVGSLLLEGGAAIHRAAWDARLVDFVRLYVTPHVLGAAGVPLFDGRLFATGALFERHVRALGIDTLIEGYVHGPR
jgi:diaminohydroxyphosphoribosylaminopyrimidine deaminase/5-amino-6-(5-phosphoribosylamino)uracil reductase